MDDWAVRGNWIKVLWSNLFLRLTTTGPSNSVDLEEEEEEEYFNKNSSIYLSWRIIIVLLSYNADQS